MTTHASFSNKHSTTREQPANWFDAFKLAGYYFQPLAMIVISIGVYLHVIRLFVGDDILIAHVFTPLFDQLLAIPMAYAGLTGILNWRRMDFKNGWHKFFMGFIVFYIAGSAPLHVATYFTHSTEYLRVFPMWFSAALLPFYATVVVTLWRLRFKP